MPIYNGTQKVKMSGIAKIYVGTQLVYQNTPVLSSIALSGFTTSYDTYATFTFTGTVTAHYSDGSTADVTSSCTHTTPDMTSAGTEAVTVTYTENNITVTASYNITISKAWRTIYNNSSGKQVLKFTTKTWTKGGVPANISSHAEQIRINYSLTINAPFVYGKITWDNGGSNATSTTGTATKVTKTFTYDQGHDIMYLTYSIKSSGSTSRDEARASWYQNGLWTGSPGSNVQSYASTSEFRVYKLEEYY